MSPQEFLQLRWIVEEFDKDYHSVLMLNNPSKTEEVQLKQYQDWFLQLERRLIEAQQSFQEMHNQAK